MGAPRGNDFLFAPLGAGGMPRRGVGGENDLCRAHLREERH